MIEAIFIAEKDDAEQSSMPMVELERGKGIRGDRYFGRSQAPGQSISFIEQEEIENYNRKHGQAISLSATRRNVITRGIRLNDLVGREFSVGGVRFLGVELCEPCETLGSRLENDSIRKKDVVKAFLHRAGIRAEILNDGHIEVGMSFDLAST